jgi:hypothetical protein
MLGGSQNYTLRLDDNSIYVINVKRPQFLISSLKRRNEYLFSISEYKLDINTYIIQNYNINLFLNTLFAIWNIRKIKEILEKLKSLIEITINTGVNSTREEMHIIGLQILVNNISFKITTDYLQTENERLHQLMLKNRSKDENIYDDKQAITFKPSLRTITEEGGKATNIRRKSIRRKLK